MEDGMSGPAFGIGEAKLAWEAGKAAYAGWHWYEKWRMGKVVISRPKNNAPVPPGRVTIEGTHEEARGIYWLIEVRGDDFRPKVRVNLKHDGSWNEGVAIGDSPEPREVILGLYWVSDFMHSILADVRKRSNELKKWDPIVMKPPRNHLKLIQGVVLNVQ
jgi:hypothetical protein